MFMVGFSRPMKARLSFLLPRVPGAREREKSDPELWFLLPSPGLSLELHFDRWPQENLALSADALYLEVRGRGSFPYREDRNLAKQFFAPR